MLDFLAGCILFSYFILFWVFIVVCLGFFFQYPLCIHIYYISPLLRISRKKKQTNQPKIPQTPTKLWRRRVGPYCIFLINGKTKFLLTRCGRERGPTRITTGARCVFFSQPWETRRLHPKWHGAAPKTLRDPSPSSRIPSFAGGGCTSGRRQLPRSSGTEEQEQQREPNPGVLQIFPSKAQRKGITLNYQVPPNILLPFTLQTNRFSNNPLTALTTSVTDSPVLRESYLLENSLRFPVVLHVTCTTRRMQEGNAELVPHFARRTCHWGS